LENEIVRVRLAGGRDDLGFGGSLARDRDISRIEPRTERRPGHESDPVGSEGRSTALMSCPSIVTALFTA